MQKYAFRMQLNPGMAEEYRRRHDAIWPELVALLKGPGSAIIRSIWTRKPMRCSACCGGR
jgi:L-rhamnose mutarotase